MPRYAINTLLVFVCCWGMVACVKKESTPVPVTAFSSPVRPAHFPPAVYQYGENVYSKEGFELGRKLFFDPLLSINNTISCGSCHKPENAFADGGVSFSPGVYGLTAKRHSPAIFNAAWNSSFMWDGGVNHIEVMPLAPLTNPREMGETVKNIVHKLNADPNYVQRFKKVFSKDTIDDQQMFRALALYMSNLVSGDTKYDRYITGKGNFTQDEQEGYTLFKSNCASCHTEPLFTNYSFQNNGIDMVFSDSGRYLITRSPADMGKFKVPSLRNIMVTYPYMHDGRFNTLEEVIDHYSDGVKQSATLSPLLVKDGTEGLKLTPADKRKLLSFLQTLTDSSFITNRYLAE